MDDIHKWFNFHSMKVNAAKTQLIVFGTKSMLRNVQPVSIKFGDHVITEQESVKNLGLTMDKRLTYETHIDQLVQKSTGTLLALSHAKHVLPTDTLPTVVSALVMSAVRCRCMARTARRNCGVSKDSLTSVLEWSAAGKV